MIQPPGNSEELLNLYESLGWNSLKLTVNDLERMCKQSWYAVYAFDEQQLVEWDVFYYVDFKSISKKLILFYTFYQLIIFLNLL